MSHTLQSEIKQSKPFPSPGAEALLGILRTAAVIDHAVAEALKPHKITPTQYNVLRILRGAGKSGLCGRDVAERLISKVPDVSRLLDRTEDLGLIRRERDADDRRHVTARITNKGLALLDRVAPDLQKVEARLARIAPKDLECLIAALDQVRSNA
jgi:DNA-binding MarR family transcriptional regulator